MNGERAETYLRLLAEAALRRAPAGEGPNGLARVSHAVAVLTAIGAVDDEIAESVSSDLEAALAARSLTDRSDLYPKAGRSMAMRMRKAHRAARAAAQAGPVQAGPVQAGPVQAGPVQAGPVQAGPGTLPSPPGGPVLAVPVGRMLVVKDQEYPGAEIFLLALVIAPGKGVISITSRLRGRHPYTSRRHAGLPMDLLSAVDNTGASYIMRFSGGVHDSWADGRLDLQPAPPPDVRWIELYADPEGPRVRIDCTSGPGHVVVSAETLPQASPGERLLDSAAESVLIHVAELGGARNLPVGVLEKAARGPAGQLTGDLDGTIEALQAADALPPDSPAPKRLAALRQTVDDTDEAAPWSAMASLPEEWASLLAYRYRRSWPRIPDGFAPVAAVLPELDGVQFILTGIRSDAEGTILHAQVLGQDPAWHIPGFRIGLDFRFALWLRDSAGHWYAASMRSWSGDDGVMTSCQLAVIPPLHRAASSLEVVLTGMSGRVRATVPLDWTTTYE